MKKQEETTTTNPSTHPSSELTSEDLKEIKQIMSKEKDFYQKIGLSSITEMNTEELS